MCKGNERDPGKLNMLRLSCKGMREKTEVDVLNLETI